MGCVMLAWIGPVEPRCCHWLGLLSVTVVDIFWVFSDLLLLVPFVSPAFDLAFPRKYSPWVWTLIPRFFFTAPVMCRIWKRGLPSVGPAFSWAHSPQRVVPSLSFLPWYLSLTCFFTAGQCLHVILSLISWVLVRPGLCHIATSPAPHTYLQFHFVFCKWHGCAQHAIWEDECKVVQIYFVNLLGMLRNEGLGHCIFIFKDETELAENRACSVHVVSVAFICPLSCEIGCVQVGPSTIPINMLLHFKFLQVFLC